MKNKKQNFRLIRQSFKSHAIKNTPHNRIISVINIKFTKQNTDRWCQL